MCDFLWRLEGVSHGQWKKVRRGLLVMIWEGEGSVAAYEFAVY